MEALRRQGGRRANEYSSDEEPQENGQDYHLYETYQDEVDEAGMQHYKTKVHSMTDEELFNALKSYGKDPGPILGSTRMLYERMMVGIFSKNHTGDGDGGFVRQRPETLNGYSDSDGGEEGAEEEEGEQQDESGEEEANEEEDVSDGGVDPNATTEEGTDEDDEIVYDINTRRYYPKGTAGNANAENEQGDGPNKKCDYLQAFVIALFVVIAGVFYYNL